MKIVFTLKYYHARHTNLYFILYLDTVIYYFTYPVFPGSTIPNSEKFYLTLKFKYNLIIAVWVMLTLYVLTEYFHFKSRDYILK